MIETRQDANISARLAGMAHGRPAQVAIAWPVGPATEGTRRAYQRLTFAELSERVDRIGRGLIEWGVQPGQRLALLVPYGPDFLTLVFGILRAGASVVLVDPGAGRRQVVNCLAELQPAGFVAIPLAQLLRRLLSSRFAEARWNVCVGRVTWGLGRSLSWLEQLGQASHASFPVRQPDDEAAVIFTSGSTGPPKGVLYTHRVFATQVDLVAREYEIVDGQCDLACFPLFGLFDALHGITTIIPDMDSTRPAAADPVRLIDAIEQWKIEQAFGSPALWTAVLRHCKEHPRRLPSLRRVMSAGAPVSTEILAGLRELTDPMARIWTPYGATEALPLAKIEANEVLDETAAATRTGGGICVGRFHPEVCSMIIAITDDPISDWAKAEPLPVGEVGELLVSGPMVTPQYVTRLDQNTLHKVNSPDGVVWHRMGDVGYLDDQGRFWFCGRKAHRVVTRDETLFSIPVEAVINTHPYVYRSALVGYGLPGQQRPVVIVEPWPEHRPKTPAELQSLLEQLQMLAQKFDATRSIREFEVYPAGLPVDPRHNAKIIREQLASWLMQRRSSSA
jgi:acyl-CoA synthetase (AMP-forming)/AMP-acid ligase II